MDTTNFNYVKRTQKDYSLSFKLRVVQEIEQVLLTLIQAIDKYDIQVRYTIRTWLKKYGNFDYDFNVNQSMSKTPEQCILELEQQVKLLEKQKARAEFLAERSDKKAIIFDIDKYNVNLDIKKELIKNPIDIYNDCRPHLSNDILTPNQMHKQNKIRRKQYKNKKGSNIKSLPLSY